MFKYFTHSIIVMTREILTTDDRVDLFSDEPEDTFEKLEKISENVYKNRIKTNNRLLKDPEHTPLLMRISTRIGKWIKHAYIKLVKKE